MIDLRVEAIGFIGYYCAVYRCPGTPDRFLDGDDGKPRRFPTAAAAIREARAALETDHAAADAPAGDSDPLGAKAWLHERDARATAERIAVFGPDGPASLSRNGRDIPVTHRRRQR